MINRSFTGPVPFVWTEDPALDKASSLYNHDEFLKTHDFAHLPVKEGAKLTVFEIRPLTKRQSIAAFAKDSTLERMDEAIAWGLRGVRGNQAFGFDFKVEHDKAERVKPDVLENLHDAILWLEMGSRILEISRLFPSSGSR